MRVVIEIKLGRNRCHSRLSRAVTNFWFGFT